MHFSQQQQQKHTSCLSREDPHAFWQTHGREMTELGSQMELTMLNTY
jgi:hypothetical protein